MTAVNTEAGIYYAVGFKTGYQGVVYGYVPEGETFDELQSAWISAASPTASIAEDFYQLRQFEGTYYLYLPREINPDALSVEAGGIYTRARSLSMATGMPVQIGPVAVKHFNDDEALTKADALRQLQQWQQGTLNIEAELKGAMETAQQMAELEARSELYDRRPDPIEIPGFEGFTHIPRRHHNRAQTEPLTGPKVEYCAYAANSPVVVMGEYVVSSAVSGESQIQAVWKKTGQAEDFSWGHVKELDGTKYIEIRPHGMRPQDIKPCFEIAKKVSIATGMAVQDTFFAVHPGSTLDDASEQYCMNGRDMEKLTRDAIKAAQNQPQPEQRGVPGFEGTVQFRATGAAK